MKGRLAIVGTLLALVSVACAGPDLAETEEELDTAPATETTATIPSSTDDTQGATTTAGTAGGAGGDTSSTTSTSAPANEPPPGSDTTVFEPGNIDRSLQSFIDKAVTDLAGRLGIAESEVTVLSAVLVVWSDTSLGCPQPDMVYAQVLQDGSLIELQAGENVYRYHTGGNQYVPFLCEQPMKQAPPTADPDL